MEHLVEVKQKHWSVLFATILLSVLFEVKQFETPRYSLQEWVGVSPYPGRQEAEKPEQLITEIVSLERESQPRQRMMAMLEAFRSLAALG